MAIKTFINGQESGVITFKGDTEPCAVYVNGERQGNVSYIPELIEGENSVSYNSEYKKNIRTMQIEGNTVPNPDFPQPIHNANDSGMSLELSGANLFDIDTVLGNMDTIVPEVPRGWAKQTDGSWYCYNCGLVAGKFLFTNVAKKQGKLTLLVCQKTTSQMVNNQVGLTYNIRYTD